MSPTQHLQTINREQLSRCSIGLGPIPCEPPVESDHLLDHFAYLGNPEVLTRPDIDEGEAGARYCHFAERGFGQLHKENARIRHVVTVQEFPPRTTSSPKHHLLRFRLLRFMALADERGQHVRSFQVVVVPRPIQVRRHHRQVLRPVLPVVRGAHLDPRDLRQRIGPVRGLQRAREKVFLLDGLRTIARVHAARSQEEKPLHAMAPGFVDHVGLDGEVGVDELGGLVAVGEDSAHLGRGEHHVFGLDLVEESAHRGEIGQVQLGVGALDEVGVAAALEAADQGGADEASVARYVDP